MTRLVTMDAYGNFTVSDDPQGVIAVALLIATAPQNVQLIEQELAPTGSGLRVQAIGSIDRVETREDLPPPYDDDPAFDPENQELWQLFRERDHNFPRPGRFIITGDELRSLVAKALALRAAK